MKYIILFVGICLIACSSEPTRSINSTAAKEQILLGTPISTKKIPTLSNEDIKNDVERIKFVLANAYAGKDILAKGAYEQLILSLEDLKKNSDSMNSDLFCEKLAGIFNQVDDFHLTANLEGRICGRTWPVGEVGINSGSREQNRTWSLLQKGKTSVLSLKQMSPDASPDWNGFIPKVKELIAGNKSFIIDLRGNGGGSTTNAYEMVRLLYGLSDQKEIPWPSKTVERIQTSTAYALTANYYWLTLQQNEEKKQAPPNYLKKDYLEFANLSKSAPQNPLAAKQIQHYEAISIDTDIMIHFPVYILIDRGCGSTCELVVEALEKLPFAHTVGENTTGVVQYGFVGWLYLSGSHVVVHIPTQGTLYSDNRQVEKVGYAPQYPAPKNEDAMNFTLKNFF